MRPWLAVFIFAALSVLAPGKETLAAPGRGGAASQGVFPAAAFDRLVAPLVATNNFAGVVLVARGDRIVFQEGYGLADRERRLAHGPDSAFHVASISKTFTSAAIMRLADQGRVDLRAPLDRYMPELPYAAKETLHDLLSHTSGIPDVFEFDAYTRDAARHWSTTELVELIASRPLKSEPGLKYDYSNSNYHILARVIEKASGLTYRAYLEREFFRPLGMTQTASSDGPDAARPGLAKGYVPVGRLGLEPAPIRDWSSTTGTATIRTTAPDLLKWIRAVHTGKVLSRSGYDATFTEHTPHAGYGWFAREQFGRKRHYDNGRIAGWAAQVAYFPDDAVTVIVLSNTFNSVTSTIADAAAAMVFGAPVAQPEPLSAASLSAAATAPLEGRYQFGEEFYTPNAVAIIVNRSGDLFAEYTDGAPPSALIPASPTRFIVRPYWSTLEFTLGPDGRARELVWDGFHARRVE